MIVNGEIVWRDGRATGKRSGKLLRNRRGTVEQRLTAKTSRHQLWR